MPDTIKPATKQELAQQLADAAGTDRKTALCLLDALGKVAAAELKRAGLVVLPGVGRIRLIHKPATEAGPGINPFTKQPMELKAKPARNTVKASPAKAIRDAVA